MNTGVNKMDTSTSARIGQTHVNRDELMKDFLALNALVNNAHSECIGMSNREQGSVALFEIEKAAKKLRTDFLKSFPLPDPFMIVMNQAEKVFFNSSTNSIQQRFKSFDVGNWLAMADPRYSYPGTYPDIPENQGLKYAHRATSWVYYVLRYLVEHGYLIQPSNHSAFYRFANPLPSDWIPPAEVRV